MPIPVLETEAILDEAVRLQLAGEVDGAERIYRQVLTLHPDNARALHNLGTVHAASGQLDPARRLVEQALAREPARAVFHATHAKICLTQNDHVCATAAYRRALELDPTLLAAWADLATLHFDARHFDEALYCCRRALELGPEDPGQLHNLAAVLIKLWHIDEALALFRRAADHPTAGPRIVTMVLFRLHFARDGRQKEILALARRFGGLLEPAGGAAPPPLRDPDPERRLRIGYVSGDLREHALAHFISPLLTQHDRSAFEVHCFDASPSSDWVSGRFRASTDAWHDIRGLSDEDAAGLVRHSAIDILVDLSGHTDHHRLGLFAHHSAPVQATWMGFMNTTGLRAMDYIIANDTLIPPGEETFYVERPLRLPGSHLCFDPLMDPPPAVGALPARARGHVTFGCFNKLDKVNADVVACWARILGALPDSRLLLKTPELDIPEVQARVIAAFGDAGVDASRLTLEGGAPRDAYCHAMNAMDIALDPFPYCGGTVTCQTLWMGVPVLTLAGTEGMIGRYGASFLEALGLEDWIAADQEEYVRKAVAFASDLDALKRLRAELRQRLEHSTVGNGAVFVAQLETALRAAWRARCAATLSG